MAGTSTARALEWERRVDELQGDAVPELLRQHLEHMLAITPLHSVFMEKRLVD